MLSLKCMFAPSLRVITKKLVSELFPIVYDVINRQKVHQRKHKSDHLIPGSKNLIEIQAAHHLQPRPT